MFRMSFQQPFSILSGRFCLWLPLSSQPLWNQKRRRHRPQEYVGRGVGGRMNWWVWGSQEDGGMDGCMDLYRRGWLMKGWLSHCWTRGLEDGWMVVWMGGWCPTIWSLGSAFPCTKQMPKLYIANKTHNLITHLGVSFTNKKYPVTHYCLKKNNCQFFCYLV